MVEKLATREQSARRSAAARTATWQSFRLLNFQFGKSERVNLVWFPRNWELGVDLREDGILASV